MRLHLSTAALLFISASCAAKVKNFIYVVPDGLGQASQTLARDYLNIVVDKQGTADGPNSTEIGADSMAIGTVRTYSADHLITDSAAAATAFACGKKTNNGVVGMDTDLEPIASVLEAAYMSGFRTGLVATSRITHATPAGYSAHVTHRLLEDDIATQQIGYHNPLGKIVHLLMGGGRRHYLPKALGGSRTDNINLIAWAQNAGASYASSKSELDKYTKKDGKVPLPFLGLFAPSHMAFELDRDPATEPSLLEMTQVAIRTLQDKVSSRDSEKGYFIMIEASRIDHAGHNNDIASHVHDTIMYNAVMAWLKKHVSQHPDTQLLSAADHETGGITLTQGYEPATLAKATRTREFLEPQLEKYNGTNLHGHIQNTVLPAYGLANASEGVVSRYVNMYRTHGASRMTNDLVRDFAESMGVRWSTDEHSAVDVTLYGFAVGEAYAEMKAALGKNVDNTMLAQYVAGVLGVSLENTTAALRAPGPKWVSVDNGFDEEDDEDDDDDDDWDADRDEWEAWEDDDEDDRKE